MKTYLIILALFLLGTMSTVQAQEPVTPEQHVERFLEMLKKDQLKALAANTRFPLSRTNPVPDLENAQDFIHYYHLLFDEKIKARLYKEAVGDIIQSNGMFGLLNGQVWLDADGSLLSVNYSSDAEQKLIAQLNAEEAAQLHPSVREFETNKHNCKCDAWKVRLDHTKDGLRMAIWENDAEFSDKPWIISSDIETEYHGTMGGTSYLVKTKQDEVMLDDVRMAEDEESVGLFIELKGFPRDGETTREKCVVLKN
ncbi:MAG: hypothetical protein AAF570_07960 [Bacteroidota bacterium]